MPADTAMIGISMNPARHPVMKCWRVQCNELATHSIKTMIPAKGVDSLRPLEVFCGAQFCAHCAQDVLIREVLSPCMKTKILDLMGKGKSIAVPDFKNAYLKVISLSDPDLLLLEAKQAVIQ